MSKFRIGDEVLCISPPDKNKEYVGRSGTIVYCRGFLLPYYVKWFGSHVSNWWCEKDSLVLLEEEN